MWVTYIVTAPVLDRPDMIVSAKARIQTVGHYLDVRAQIAEYADMNSANENILVGGENNVNHKAGV